jgi:hypothetical protein
MHSKTNYNCNDLISNINVSLYHVLPILSNPNNNTFYTYVLSSMLF